LSPTPTFTPGAGREASIAIYNDKGEKIRQLAPSLSSEPAHSVNLSVNPLRANGVNTVILTDSLGETIGIWDGKDSGGRVVFSGMYIVQVKTTDKDGNESAVNVKIDVIAGNSYNVTIEARYLDDGNIRITGAAVNVEWVIIRIYNIYGGLVRKYGPVGPAGYDFTWDRTGSNGGKVAGGLYLATVEFKDSRTGLISSKKEKIAVRY